MGTGIVVTGDLKVALKFDQFPAQAHKHLLSRITDLTARLESRILATINRKTGKLAAQVEMYIDQKPDSIRGKVKIIAPDRNDLLKAMALEYGSHRAIEVRIRQSLGALSRRSKPSTYTRITNVPEFKMMRGPFAAMAPEAQAELRLAMIQATAE